MIHPKTFSFLRNLARNNNRDWFNQNKSDYERAKKNVVEFTEELINKSSEFDSEMIKIDSTKALFRIYRDTRFSLDKTPYKTNFGIGLGFKNSKAGSGYYLHLQPGKSFVAGGVYHPESSVLKKIRQEISSNKDEFIKIIEHDDFRNNFRGLSVENKLQRVPTGFEKDNPMAEFLKLKNFNVSHPISDEILMSNEAVVEVARIFKSIKPLNDFLELPFD